MTYAIEAINVCKYFGNLKANDDITIHVEKGTVHAICGENGAGKSTLMNVLYGLYLPTAGHIRINEEDVSLKNPKDAIERGIGMVHQHFMLIQNLTIAENIVLGQETGTKLFLDRKKAIKEVEELCEKYNLHVDPKARVDEITVGMQQRVEILKALYRGVDLLILDEPTAVLAPQEIEELFENIRLLVSKGKTVIIITHKLNEVLEISNRISVLRLGKLIGTVNTNEVDESKLTQMMVGRDVVLGGRERKETIKKDEVLKIENLSLTKGHHKALDEINIDVKSGEIVGIAGIDGNGQSELIEIVSGLLKHYTGEVEVNGENIKRKNVRKVRADGLGYIPEDRHRDGLVLDYSVAENMILGQHYHEPFAKNYFLKFNAINDFAEQNIKDFDIRTMSKDSLASTLSGGNQQKIILARETCNKPKFILASQPTRGLDVGAIEFVHNTLVEARNNEQGILLVSFELDEILALCDRLYVFHMGKVVGELKKEEFDVEEIGKMMLGLREAKANG
ncbi:ABC transporter ATP-binding protein [Anaerorhabdus furcosa]|uniref:Simple sugar transport system ATP-binding protein n=1 Tax=Anaerorhabdus furcosa TaxID=118967 RepID=A0A1T4Q2R1_9FIRM|nr:ABC transporter ATP-binding protein [Anaerorhabdus furcosa]SJZ98090.1 simple sugar transport system ATP-binding protein [Anaerorhabdus furcosa]